MLVIWFLFLSYLCPLRSRKMKIGYLTLCLVSWLLVFKSPYFVGKVYYCKPHRCMIQSVLSRTYVPRGKLEIGSWVIVKHSAEKILLSPYRSYKFNKILQVKSVQWPSIHRYLYRKNSQAYQYLFANTMPLYTSLLFKSFYRFFRKILRRFTYRERQYTALFLILFGLLGRRSLFYWHTVMLFLKIPFLARILILNILYPQVYLHAGFQIYEGLNVLKHLSYRFSALSPKLFMAQVLFYHFHQWSMLSPVLLIGYRVLGAFVFVLLCFSFWKKSFLVLVEKMFVFLNKWKQNTFLMRFHVYGSLSLFSFLLLLLCRNKKQQFILFLCLLVLKTYPLKAQVCFIDVGQGDSTLISLPFQARNYLFDTGRSFAYQSLKSDLHALGIGKVNTLLISHDDKDHCENKDALLFDFFIDKVIEKKQESYEIFNILLADKHFDDANENSLILSFNIWGWRFLMTGDAYQKQELQMLREGLNRYDVLKLGHHGSKTSSHPQFIAHIRPRYGIVSASSRYYQHPHPQVMATLRQFAVKPLLTEKEGTICFYLWPKIGIIRTKEGGFGIITKGESHD